MIYFQAALLCGKQEYWLVVAIVIGERLEIYERDSHYKDLLFASVRYSITTPRCILHLSIS